MSVQSYNFEDLFGKLTILADFFPDNDCVLGTGLDFTEVDQRTAVIMKAVHQLESYCERCKSLKKANFMVRSTTLGSTQFLAHVTLENTN